jgi:hypothetical protein
MFVSRTNAITFSLKASKTTDLQRKTQRGAIPLPDIKQTLERKKEENGKEEIRSEWQKKGGEREVRIKANR